MVDPCALRLGVGHHAAPCVATCGPRHSPFDVVPARTHLLAPDGRGHDAAFDPGPCMGNSGGKPVAPAASRHSRLPSRLFRSLAPTRHRRRRPAAALLDPQLPRARPCVCGGRWMATDIDLSARHARMSSHATPGADRLASRSRLPHLRRHNRHRLHTELLAIDARLRLNGARCYRHGRLHGCGGAGALAPQYGIACAPGGHSHTRGLLRRSEPRGEGLGSGMPHRLHRIHSNPGARRQISNHRRHGQHASRYRDQHIPLNRMNAV
jgi:hypothetical protein